MCKSITKNKEEKQKQDIQEEENLKKEQDFINISNNLR